MASKLAVYQEALEHLGERRLSDLTEAREPRYLLDDAWDGSIQHCLEQGFWNWAMRSVQVVPENATTTAFGYARTYIKPTDWVRTYVVSEDERFELPTEDFIDENGYWFSDAEALYVRYVSNDAAFGANLTQWPQSFTTFVALHLARRICRRLTNSQEMFETFWKLEKMAKADAQSKDAMNEGNRRMPLGTWVRSRGSSTTSSRWNRTFR